MKNVRNRKLWSRSLLLTVIIFMIGCQSLPVSAATTKKNWYINVLNSVNKSYSVKDRQGARHKVHLKNYTHYKLLDINGDGTKELLLSASKESTYHDVIVLTYYKKKVVPLIYLDDMYIGSGHISYKNKYLCDYVRVPDIEFPGEDSYSFYQLKYGKLKLAARMEYEHGVSNKDGSTIREYSVNGKKCSKAKYDKYLKKYKKYYTKGKKVKFSPIPVDRSKLFKSLRGTWHTWGIGTASSGKTGYRYKVKLRDGYFVYTDLNGKSFKDKIKTISRTKGGYWITVKGKKKNYYYKYEANHPNELYYFWKKSPDCHSGTSSLER